MSVSLYSVSAPIFVQFLTGLSGVIDKASAFAEAKKVDPSVLVNLRLAPDMHPFARQIRMATDHAAGGVGRLAGVDLPTFSTEETTLAELKARIATVTDFIKGVKPSQVDGQEGREVVLKFPSGERRFTGQADLLYFAIPNFYFHTTTAYDIMRNAGVDVGKRDFMSAPVTL